MPQATSLKILIENESELKVDLDFVAFCIEKLRGRSLIT